MRGPSLAAGAAGRWNGRRMVVVSLRKRQAQGQSVFFIIFAPRRGEKIVVSDHEVKNGRQNIHLQKRRLLACHLLKLRQLRIHALSISRDAGIVIRIDADDQHIALGGCLLERVQMAAMQQIKHAIGEADDQALRPPDAHPVINGSRHAVRREQGDAASVAGQWSRRGARTILITIITSWHKDCENGRNHHAK